MLHFGELITIPTVAVRGVRGGNGASWPAHEIIEGKPRSQFIGAQAGDLALSLFLHVAHIAPRPTVTRLREISEAGEVFQVWTSAGSYWGTYKIDRVDHSVRWALPRGQWIAASCELTLGDPGTEASVALARPAALDVYAASTTTERPTEDTSTPADEITPEQIARL